MAMSAVDMALEKIRQQIADLQRAEAAIVAAFGEAGPLADKPKRGRKRKAAGLPVGADAHS
jgi:hypothetical protein